MKNLFISTIVALFMLLSANSANATVHYIQMPGGNQNFCQDSLAMDTFIFIKPLGFGSTMWYIDFIPQGIYDSLVFVPTSSGLYPIGAVWNSNTEQAGLGIFTGPPAHVNINLAGGSSGYINSTHDTAWMCGGNPISITLASQSGSDGTYEQWTGPNSFFSTSSPISVSIPGTYVFERGNPCDTTYDSIHVVNLPNTLPVWNDTSFCNTQVSLSLDAGSGWDSYLWNTSETSQNISVDTLLTDTTVTYSVVANNMCATDSSSFVIEQWNYPTPDLTQFNMVTPFCADSVLTLDPSPGFVYDNYLWSWHNGTSTDSILEITGDTITGSGVYTIDIDMGFGCHATASDSFAFYPKALPIAVCVITVDTSGQMKIVWEKNEIVDSYNIYRLGSNGDYNKVAQIPYSQTSQWYDTTGINPSVSAYRYKVSANHLVCGDEGPLGEFHGSIHITDAPGSTGGVNLTVTDQYIDGSGQYIPNTYYILIDSLNNGQYAVLDSMSAVFNSYLVQNPLQGATYAMAVALPWACNPSKGLQQLSIGKSKAPTTFSISNKSDVIMSIGNHNKPQINIDIYPNPSSGIFYIQTQADVEKIDVYNNMGQLILSQSKTDQLDLSKFDKGMYYIVVQNALGQSGRQKLILN